MAVSTYNTTFEDMEGAPTIVGYGGGQGASVNTDAYIEGAQSVGRRVDNTTAKGQGVSVTAVDLSGANVHAKMWVICNHWAEVTKLVIRVSSGSDDDHTYPAADIPYLGGWIPLWVDVSRAPETGGSANEASISEIGCLLDIGDVGGSAPNLMIDEILYTGVLTNVGLRWTGLGGDMQDFRDFEATNNEGNLVVINGIDYCYSRLHLGDASATQSTFTDSGFTVVFPDQALVADDFMGIYLIARTSDSAVTLSDCNFQSANPNGATKRPDLLCNLTPSGTLGDVSLTNVNAVGMRLIQLDSRLLWDGGTLDTLELAHNSVADWEVKNCNIKTRSAVDVACYVTAFSTSFGSSSGIHDCDITQADAGHSIEYTGTADLTLTNLNFSGYAAADGNDGDEAIFINPTNIIDANTDESSSNSQVMHGSEGWEAGQSFTGDGSSIKRIAVWTRKNGNGGSPSGSIYIDIYAHTGTFGTSGTPTGASLGTSAGIAVSTISNSSDSWQVFEFATPVSTVNTTKYFWVMSSPDNSPLGGPDDIGPIYGSSSTHGGNRADYGTSWNATSGSDHSFALFDDTNSELTINISGGNTPSIRSAGTVVTVLNAKVLTLTNIPTGVQVTIVNSSTRTELQNSTSTGADITYSHSGGETVDILLMHNSYDPNVSDVYDLTLPSADSSIKFNLLDDLNYENP